ALGNVLRVMGEEGREKGVHSRRLRRDPACVESRFEHGARAVPDKPARLTDGKPRHAFPLEHEMQRAYEIAGRVDGGSAGVENQRRRGICRRTSHQKLRLCATAAAKIRMKTKATTSALRKRRTRATSSKGGEKTGSRREACHHA